MKNFALCFFHHEYPKTGQYNDFFFLCTKLLKDSSSYVTRRWVVVKVVNVMQWSRIAVIEALFFLLNK